MQTYHCSHCGIECDAIFNVFLHIFTDHRHADIGLEQGECQRLIGKTQPYKLKTWAVDYKVDGKAGICSGPDVPFNE